MYSLSTTDIQNQSLDGSKIQIEFLDSASKMLEKHMELDRQYSSLSDKMRIKHSPNLPTVSGFQEYPRGTAFANIKQLVSVNKISLPPEIISNFTLIQKHSLMGIFSDINRAWLAVDCTIFIWDYEYRSDICFYDVKSTIVGVGLVKVKPNIFQSNVKYVLVLSTEEKVVIHGIIIPDSKDGQDGIQFVHQALYTLQTDGVRFSTVQGSSTGRIFLGGDDGNLYEIEYQKEASWFSNSCRKINLTKSTLTYILPQFLNALIAEEAEIVQIVFDNSRHILYTRSIIGRISVFDLCDRGQGFRYLASLSQDCIAEQASLEHQKVKSIPTSFFQPIVSISAIEARENLLAGLIAICESGARLYFNVGFTEECQRPSGFNLVHVRLPPNSNINTPLSPNIKVNLAHYSQGNLLVTTTSLGIEESIRCFSSDPYPFNPNFIEAQTYLPLDSTPWVLEEVGSITNTSACTKPLPPLVVRQHYERLSKYVALGPAGVEVFVKLRPVDMLAQLFKEGNGPDSQSVKQYFQIHGEDQACATCLVLACNANAQNATVSDYAKRAFFLYGGEPRLAPQIIAAQETFQAFSPKTVSTPRPLHVGPHPLTIARPVTSPSVNMSDPNITVGGPVTREAMLSAKHNSLYLFVGRILRPIWNIRVVTYKMSDTGLQLDSSVTLDEITLVCSHMQSVRSFLKNNPSILPVMQPNTGRDPSFGELSAEGSVLYKNRLQEICAMERKSLEVLKAFIEHACQVLGFWRILCEHHFPSVAAFLTEDQKTQLINLSFQQLTCVASHQDVYAVLMNSLLNYYLEDNTPIQSVSLKLSEVCPKIFRDEDATCAKANELVMYAKKKVNKEEKEQYLRNSLKLYREVIPRINLHEVCSQYALSQFHEGVVAICLDFAKKIDPNDLGGRFYYNNQGMEGEAAYSQRMECYNEVLSMLDQLHSSEQSASRSAAKLPRSPGYCPMPIAESHAPSTQEIQTQIKRVIHLCLNSSDTLLQASIYSWMIKNEMIGELINSSKPSLERYLIRNRNLQQTSATTAEFNNLLWKYHERHGNHATAADILMSMAKQSDNNANLHDRCEYLAKAVMCMCNQESGGVGQYIHELKDLQQIASVQKRVLVAISDIHNTAQSPELKHATQVAMDELNNNLFDLSKLFNNYADPFELWECKLFLIEIGSYRDDQLIQTIWQNILQVELDNCNIEDPNNKLRVVMSKVEALYSKFESDSFCVPLDFLVYQMEFISYSLQASPEVVQQCFVNMGVSFKALIPIYEDISKKNGDVWYQNGDPLHLVLAIGYLAANFIEKNMRVPTALRKQLAFKLQDMITNCLSTLYTKTNVEQEVQWLKDIQERINDISLLP